MRFWDSSALVALVIEEERSDACRGILAEDGSIAVWALTRTEIHSAARRKERVEALGRSEVENALARIGALEESWTEIGALERVRDRAERLLAVHPLRAADSLQLAAALVLCDDRPRAWGFVTADDLLARAASAEGFRVVVPANR